WSGRCGGISRAFLPVLEHIHHFGEAPRARFFVLYLDDQSSHLLAVRVGVFSAVRRRRFAFCQLSFEHRRYRHGTLSLVPLHDDIDRVASIEASAFPDSRLMAIA